MVWKCGPIGIIALEVYIADGEMFLRASFAPSNFMGLVIFILRTYAIWKRKTAIGWLFAFSWVASFAGVGYWLEKIFEIGKSFTSLRI
jgi:hypothetical protein